MLDLEIIKEIIEVVETKKIILKKPRQKSKIKKALEGKELDDYIVNEFKESMNEHIAEQFFKHLYLLREEQKGLEPEKLPERNWERFDYIIKGQFKKELLDHPQDFYELLKPIMKSSNIESFIKENLQALYVRAVNESLDKWGEENKEMLQKELKKVGRKKKQPITEEEEGEDI